MAIVKTKKWGNCTINITDDAIRDLSPEELKKREAEVKQNILNIIERARMRQLEKEMNMEE